MQIDKSNTSPYSLIPLAERNKGVGIGGLDTTTTSFDSGKSSIDREGFSKRLVNFIQKTEDHAIQATNPGGYYTGIWCRDSSYILKDWFQSGRIQSILNQILVIWSHQIDWANGDRIIFGRGSPDMNFKPTVADKKSGKKIQRLTSYIDISWTKIMRSLWQEPRYRFYCIDDLIHLMDPVKALSKGCL